MHAPAHAWSPERNRRGRSDKYPLSRWRERAGVRVALGSAIASGLQTDSPLAKSNHDGFGIELDAEALEHFRLDSLRERPDLFARGAAVVDQHERMLFRHSRHRRRARLSCRMPRSSTPRKSCARLPPRSTSAARDADAEVRAQRPRRQRGFLKKLPALPITAGFGSLRVRRRATASATVAALAAQFIAASSSAIPA